MPVDGWMVQASAAGVRGVLSASVLYVTVLPVQKCSVIPSLGLTLHDQLPTVVLIVCRFADDQILEWPFNFAIST